MHISFYKQYGTFPDPDNKTRIIDVETIKCHEFPNFACIFESKLFVESNYDWKNTTLSELITYFKLKAPAFSLGLRLPEKPWVDDYTARLELV